MSHGVRRLTPLQQLIDFGDLHIFGYVKGVQGIYDDAPHSQDARAKGFIAGQAYYKDQLILTKNAFYEVSVFASLDQEDLHHEETLQDKHQTEGD